MKKIAYLIFFLSGATYAQQDMSYSVHLQEININAIFDISDGTVVVNAFDKQWNQFNDTSQLNNISDYPNNISDYPIEKTGLITSNYASTISQINNFKDLYSFNNYTDSLSSNLSNTSTFLSQKPISFTAAKNGNSPNYAYNTKTLEPKSDNSIHYQPRDLYKGFSINNLNVNTNANQNPKTILNYFLSATLLVKQSQNLTFRPQVIVKAANGLFSLDAGLSLLLKKLVWIGAIHKNDNSINGIVQMQVNRRLRLGLVHDISRSEFKSITQGPYEFTINYRYQRPSSNIAMFPRLF